jgi:two-component system, cell cycle sensor histidine kinase and response regulator CckA
MARILIVEDEKVVAFDLKDLLESNGHSVIAVCEFAEEAVAHAPALKPDLVLMDIHLKGAETGISAAGKLQRGEPVPVLFLTAFADKATVAAAAQQGAYGYVVKPYSEPELLASIEVALFKASVDKAARAREEWVTTTLRSIGDAVVATDPAGRVRFLNPAAEALTGWTVADALARPIEEVVVLREEKTRAPVELPSNAAMQQDAVVALVKPCVLLRRDSTEVIVDDCGAPIHDGEGRIGGSVLILRDISEKRLLESRLALQARLAGLGTLSAGIAHEINNPLTYVITNLMFITEGIGKAAGADQALLADLQQCLADAQLGASRIRTIVSDMKLFAHPQASTSTFDLREALEDACRFTSHEVALRAAFEKAVAGQPVLVHGDKQQLSQLIGILLVNAAQAIPEGGAGERRVTLRLEASGSEAVVTVSDTGVGMTPEVLVRIFDPFFTTKPVGVGTGLGLSIAHGIAEAHGAQMRVRSKPGSGTAVEFRLATQRQPAALPASLAATRAVQRRRLLLVDDDPLVLRALQRQLASHHEVAAVLSGGEALTLLAAGMEFDLLLIDLLMPELSGVELHQRICQAHPHLSGRMAFLSGGAFTPATQAFAQQHAELILKKPASTAALDALFEKLLDEELVDYKPLDAGDGPVSAGAPGQGAAQGG